MAARRSPVARTGKGAKCLADLGYGHLDRDDFHETQLPGIAEALGNLQDEFEASGQFLEAELVRQRLEYLRKQAEARLHEEYQSRQVAERLGVEEAHMQELQEFNELWDCKDNEFETHVCGLQQTLAGRQLQAQRAYREKIEEETEPRQPRWSKEVLNLKKIVDTLAKQKNYVEAAKVKEDLDKHENKEYAMWKAKRDSKLAGLEEQFLTKHQMEMTGLISRIEANRCEHKLAKKRELDRILQRYHNVKTQMQSQQKIKYQRANQYREVDLETSSVCSRPSLLGGTRAGLNSAPHRTPDNTRASFNGGSQRSIVAGNLRRDRDSINGANPNQRQSTATVRPSNSSPALGQKALPASMAFAPPKRSTPSAGIARVSTNAVEGKRGAPATWK